MENKIQFGIINLPETFNSTYGNGIYTAPSILSKEMMEKISFSKEDESDAPIIEIPLIRS